MEKRHYKQGVISQLKTNDDETVNSDKEILNQCESFYKTLYSSQTNINVLKEINSLFYDFLWKGKGDKIKPEVMTNDYAKGGLK